MNLSIHNENHFKGLISRIAEIPNLFNFELCFLDGNRRYNNINFSELNQVKEFTINKLPHIAIPNIFKGMNNLQKLKIRTIDKLENIKECFLGLNNLKLLELEELEEERGINGSLLTFIIENNDIKRIKINDVHVFGDISILKFFQESKKRTKLSICCSDYYELKEFKLKKLDWVGDIEKHNFLILRCPNCMFCKCGSKNDTLIWCSRAYDYECNDVGCKDCFFSCESCEEKTCKMHSTKVEFCQSCRKTSCGCGEIVNCSFCHKEICEECRYYECPSVFFGCFNEICYECKNRLVYCDTCKRYVGCDNCSICSFCKEKHCRFHRPRNECLVKCSCVDKDLYLQHYACKNHCREIKGEIKCFHCHQVCNQCQKLITPENDCRDLESGMLCVYCSQ